MFTKRKFEVRHLKIPKNMPNISSFCLMQNVEKFENYIKRPILQKSKLVVGRSGLSVQLILSPLFCWIFAVVFSFDAVIGHFLVVCLKKSTSNLLS